MDYVIKRSGKKEPFNRDKVVRAVLLSFESVDGKTDKSIEEIANSIADFVSTRNDDMSVEDIQDLIERRLMTSSRKDVAKAYINYRYLHGMARDRYRDLMSAVEEKLMASNVQNQNANVDEASFGGRMGEANDVVMKRFALDKCMSPVARRNHENNEIYTHDLNSYSVGSHNCLSIPFDHLLANGFNTRQTDVRPAQSINTAFQLVAVIFQLQSLMQFGGVSATHLDWTMVPYVRKSFVKHYKDGLKYLLDDEVKFDLSKDEAKEISIDNKEIYSNPKAYRYAMDMTKKELYQAVEGMYHNLNTLQSRSGNQLN